MPCNVAFHAMQFNSWTTVVMTALALLAGCSTGPKMDYAKAGLVQVGGVVKFGGTPLADALVIFENPDNGTFSFARTDGTGRYALMFDSVQPGVTKGRKTVRIKTAGSFGEGDPDARSAGGKELLPACYNAASKLVVEVTGPSNDINFDLNPAGQ
jgi:hypothetical protein